MTRRAMRHAVSTLLFERPGLGLSLFPFPEGMERREAPEGLRDPLVARLARPRRTPERSRFARPAPRRARRIASGLRGPLRRRCASRRSTIGDQPARLSRGALSAPRSSRPPPARHDGAGSGRERVGNICCLRYGVKTEFLCTDRPRSFPCKREPSFLPQRGQSLGPAIGVLKERRSSNGYARG